jgi:hypothetical protein
MCRLDSACTQPHRGGRLRHRAKRRRRHVLRRRHVDNLLGRGRVCVHERLEEALVFLDLRQTLALKRRHQLLAGLVRRVASSAAAASATPSYIPPSSTPAPTAAASTAAASAAAASAAAASTAAAALMRSFGLPRDGLIREAETFPSPSQVHLVQPPVAVALFADDAASLGVVEAPIPDVAVQVKCGYKFNVKAKAWNPFFTL